MPSIKYNLKLVPSAYILSPQDLDIFSTSSLVINLLSSCNVGVRVLLKLVQNFFPCVPDQCARNAVKAAK